MVGLLAAVLLQIGLARLLGPAAFGLFGLAVSVQHFAMIAQDGGWRALLLRETVRPSPELAEQEGRLPSFAWGHALLATAVAAALVLPAFGSALAAVLVAAVLGGLAKAGAGFVSASMLGRGRFLAEAHWQVAVRVLTTAAALLVAMLSPEPLHVLLALAAAQFALLAPSFHGIGLPRPRLPRNSHLYAFLGKLALLALVTAVYFRAGPILLYMLTGDLVAVSHFALMHRLLDAALFLVAPLAQIAHVAARGRSGFGSLDWVGKGPAAAWVIALGVAAAIGFREGEAIVGWVAGPDYAAAGELAGPFALALLFAGPNFVMMQLLIAANRENALVARSLLAMTVGLAASLLLIPPYGALGAALGVLAAEAALALMLLGSLKRASRNEASNSYLL